MQVNNLWQLFVETVNRLPNDRALAAVDRELTYRELKIEVDQYVKYLQKAGIKQGDRVAILLPRDSKLVVTILAVLACGASYIPLDARYPQARIQAILDDSQCKFIISTASANSYRATIISPPGQQPLNEGMTAIKIQINPHDLAYIIYTSGSTGKPKGVMINHGNAASMINWALATFNKNELIYTLASTSICFDLSIFEIFVPLAVGGCIVLVDNALALAEKNVHKPISLINTVPSAIQELLRLNAIPESVTTINLAGEALQQIIVNQLYEQTKVKRIYNLYGPSETTTYSTYYLAKSNIERTMVPIGKPISGTEIFLLDQHQRPVPPLGKGEIYITGPGVSQGYCNRANETASHFVELNVGDKKLKFYRTGDLARINHQRELEYLGRIDQQIKIRGFRIEPGEITHRLMQNDKIHQAYVMTHPDVDAGQELIVYVVSSKNSSTFAPSLLKEWLVQALPDYMVPKYFIELAQMPLNSNGKIDRNALPLPQAEQFIDATYQNTLEQQLAAIWQQILPTSSFDRQTNFFHIGGHSLLAARLLAKIRERFLVDYQLEEIFHHPTIAEQAKLIVTRQAVTTVPTLFKALPRLKEIPLTYSQQRLWFLQRAEYDKPISNIPIVVTLQGELDIDALEKSFKCIIDRHEILRTTYHSNGNKIIQVVSETFHFDLPVIDCQNINQNDLDELLSVEANQIFDLSKDLMLHARLFKQAKNKFVLMVIQHHIASDAWSLNILMQELSTYYQAFHRNQSLPELPKPVQYADYSCWQYQYLTAELLQKDLVYWQGKLKDAADVIKLPYDFPRSDVQSFRGEFYYLQLNREVVNRLKLLANENQCTLFMVLLTAFNILLYRYSQQNDFCVGILTANRPYSELHHTLGFFVNTLVTRNQIDSNTTVKELLAQVRHTVLESLAHQLLPFDKLVDALQATRQVSRHPLFQVLFSLQNALENDLYLDGLTVEAKEYDRKISKFDLTLSLVEKNEELSAIFEYCTDLFHPDTIARMTTHYVQILNNMVNNLGQSVAAIDLLTVAERQKFITEFNNTQRPYADKATLSQLFAQSVINYPEKIALISERQQLTYAELDAKANQLANLLVAYDVKLETPVALLLPRSIDAIVTILAIIKAGGSYIPLDPAWPVERLNYIIEDAEVNVVITLQRYLSSLPAHSSLFTIALDEMAEKIIAQSKQTPAPTGGPENCCYIMYTSGSTGKPKGVIIRHQGVIRLVNNVDYVELNEQQRLLQVSPLAFDGSTFDIWGSLLNGATLVLIPDGVPALNKLADLIGQHRITTLFITTQLFNALVDYKLPQLNSLQQLLFGGEVASLHHVERFKQAHPNCQLRNIYGPTECTTFALSYLIPNDFDKSRPLPLGIPIANTYAMILTEKQLLAPVGVAGEICLGGPGLAKAYLHQTALTVQKFISNPIKELEIKYLYRTGDIGCYRADGVIDFIGRIDNQVKVRGHRIELHEIEQILRDLDSIHDAVVILQKPEDLLVAYVIVDAEKNVQSQTIRQWLATKLPHYMLPDAIEILPEYPLTANGKVDKERLPRCRFQHEQISEQQLSTDNSIAPIVYQIWAEALEDNEISYEDNFFEIGGNSLKIVHVLEKLQNHFSKDETMVAKLEIAALFQYPTINSLANYLSSEVDDDKSANRNQRRIRQEAKRKAASMTEAI